jgi:hypothetical protein
MRHFVCLSAAAFCLASGIGVAEAPAIPVAPGTPVCDAGADPFVCAWSNAGLPSDVSKYAVEATAAYDPDCNGAVNLTRVFSLTTPNASPTIDIADAAFDTTVCTSNDNPCTVPGYLARALPADPGQGARSAVEERQGLAEQHVQRR